MSQRHLKTPQQLESEIAYFERVKAHLEKHKSNRIRRCEAAIAKRRRHLEDARRVQRREEAI